ncbi:MAG: tyrosine-type recombinase/integrase [Candidatus Xenobia bacterium]
MGKNTLDRHRTDCGCRICAKRRGEGGAATPRELPPGIFERGGSYWVQYTNQGKRHREKAGTLKQAERLLATRRADALRGKLDERTIGKPARPVTLAEAIEAYMEESRARKDSWKTDEHHARVWLRELGDRDLRDISAADVERWRRRRAASPTRQGDAPAAASLRLAIVFLSGVFSMAIRDGKATENPCKQVKHPKLNNARIRYLRDEEQEAERLEAAFAAFSRPTWRSRWHDVQIARHTGLRRSEQLELRWERIDLVRRVIRVPKSKHGEARYIEINDVVLDILQTMPSRLKSAWVYPGSSSDGHAGESIFRKPFEAAVERAGLDDFTWHDLRHDFASRLVMSGVDLYTVQQLMGHKTIAMTQRYAHLSPTHRLAAVNRLVNAPEAESRSARTNF